MKTGLYQHKNGNLYQVMGVAKHSETMEELVVYQALYGSYGLWVRPKNMFEQLVEQSNGDMTPRFKFVKDNFGNSPETQDRSVLKANNISSNWFLNSKNHLEANFKFADYNSVMQFVTSVGKVANDMDHHPKISFEYNSCNVEIWSHDSDALTQRDFDFTKSVDNLYS